MKIHIQRSEDVETVREAHSLAFPRDPWPGDDHEYWLATDGNGRVVGFASAIYWGDLKTVFLSRAAVVESAQGTGLQRRFISARVRWAKTIPGCEFVWTYVERWNYASLYNLLRCGFMALSCHRLGVKWHALVLHLRHGSVPPLGRIFKRA
jgi:RimJ/RimL family protein N-acetyltransferase